MAAVALSEKQRRFERRPISVKVQLVREKKYGVERCESISEGGMLLQVSKLEYTVGDMIEINYLVPNNSTYTTHGEVIYLVKAKPEERYAFQMGVQFVNPPPAMVAAIKNFVNS